MTKLKAVLVSGECFRNSPSQWFSLSTFVKDSFETDARLQTTLLHKWTLLKFVSVYRTPLTLYLRTHVDYLTRHFEGAMESQQVAHKEELLEIFKEVKNSNSSGSKGFSKSRMTQELYQEWTAIKSTSSDPLAA